MAKVSVSMEMLAEIVFGFVDNPVDVVGVEVDEDRRTVRFDITGPDVPDAEEVRAVIETRQNRAGQRLNRMTFDVSERELPS